MMTSSLEIVPVQYNGNLKHMLSGKENGVGGLLDH